MPPQYTDHADQVIEKGTSLRLKILGVKPDVAAINAIGTIKEDYLGYDALLSALLFRFLPKLPSDISPSQPALYDILMECAQTPIMPIDERKYIHCILMIYTNIAATTCSEVLEPDSRAGGRNVFETSLCRVGVAQPA